MKIIKQWWCGIKGHDWTCAAKEGIAPTSKQLRNGIEGFENYAIMYCKKCKYISKFNRK